MKLTIAIVSWNTQDLLRKCLLSIQEHCAHLAPGDLEVVVVDNASSDGSAEMVRAEFPSAILIRNKDNAGFARASNQAIRSTHGEYVVLLNPDAEIGRRSMDILVDFMALEPAAGAAGPRLLNSDGSLQVSCYPAPTLLREFWRLFHLDSLRPIGSYRMSEWNLQAARAVDVLKGACVMLRREVLEQCGLLDEDYFIYSEDQDLCRKVRGNGWKVYWVPQATVVHHGGMSTGQVEAEMFLRLYQGNIAYFRKHEGSVCAYIYKLILLAASLVRQLMGPLALLKSSATRERDREVARHYRQLVKALPGL